MTTEVLREKTGRYLCGQAVPADTKQIQNWLSCTGGKVEIAENDRQVVQDEILRQVKAYVASSTLEPVSYNWWKKFTGVF